MLLLLLLLLLSWDPMMVHLAVGLPILIETEVSTSPDTVGSYLAFLELGNEFLNMVLAGKASMSSLLLFCRPCSLGSRPSTRGETIDHESKTQGGGGGK